MELKGSFTVTEQISLNKDSAPCTDDPNYSFSKCIKTYITKCIGCRLDWFNPALKAKISPCTTREQVLFFEEQVTRLQSASWNDVFAETGCMLKCRTRHFSFIRNKEEVVTWKRDWSSSFYLRAETTMLREENEFWIFDTSDTINGIGGAMGLFLGWSLLFLLQKLAKSAKEFFIAVIFDKYNNIFTNKS